jgi:hypothetical protein
VLGLRVLTLGKVKRRQVVEAEPLFERTLEASDRRCFSKDTSGGDRKPVLAFQAGDALVRHRSYPIDGERGNRSFFVCRSGRASAIFQVLAETLSALDSRNRGLPFSALNLIPFLGELGLVEPKLKLAQFFDFRLGIRRRRPLQSPPCLSAARFARSWSFVAQPAAPIERALFCLRSSQVLSVESPATAPVLRLTPAAKLDCNLKTGPYSLWQTHEDASDSATANTVPAKMTFVVKTIQPI